MLRFVLALLAGLIAAGADDPWAKVKELKSGSELKIWKRGASQPVEAIYDDLGQEKLLVVMKNEQVAIPRDGIDRIDARPSSKGSKPKVETTMSKGATQPERVAAPPRGQREDAPGAQTMTSSSSLSFGKPGFETVYRRMPAAPGAPDK